MKTSPGSKLIQTYQLPKEIKLAILSILADFSDIKRMFRVSKEWQGAVQKIASDWIDTYFPYLKKTKPNETNSDPLKVLTKEFISYMEDMKCIHPVQYKKEMGKLEHIMAALRGDKEKVAKIVGNDLHLKSNQLLCALLLMNGHTLPTLNYGRFVTQNDVYSLALARAAYYGNLAAVKRILTEDIKLSFKIEGSCDPLSLAAMNNHLSVVQHLLTVENKPEDYIDYAFEQAAMNRNYLVLQHLYKTEAVSNRAKSHAAFICGSNLPFEMKFEGEAEPLECRVM